MVQIISKKATGLWIGKVGEQVGHFKFINVRILPDGTDPFDPDDAYGQGHHHFSLSDLNPEERQNMADVISGENEVENKSDLDTGTPIKGAKSRGKAVRKGRPKGVGDLLHRIGLDVSCYFTILKISWKFYYVTKFVKISTRKSSLRNL